MSVTEAGKAKSGTTSGRRWGLPLILLCTGGLVWGGWAWWNDYRYKSAMATIESEIMAGRYAIACRDLEKLLSWKADSNGGIRYLLGSCELARGRNSAADEAWARIGPGLTFSEKAIRGACGCSRIAGNSQPPRS